MILQHNTRLHVYMHIDTGRYIVKHLCMHTYPPTRIIYTHTRACIQTCLHTCIHTYLHTYILAYIHT